MRVVIFGSRSLEFLDFSTFDFLIENFRKKYPDHSKFDEVISGGARGIDTFARKWAKWKCIPFNEFAAEWKRHGKMAGYIRNELMAEVADIGLAIWDGSSRGTAHMIEQMRERCKSVYVISLDWKDL